MFRRPTGLWLCLLMGCAGGGGGGETGGTGGSGGAAGTSGTAGTTGSAGTTGLGGGGPGGQSGTGALGGQSGTGTPGGQSGTAGPGGRGGTGAPGGQAGTNAQGGQGGGGRGGTAGTAPGGSSGGGAMAGGSGAGGRGGTGGGASNPCAARTGLRFCDDFESKPAGTLQSSPPWTVQLLVSTGTVTIDTSVPAHSGTKSVKVHASDTDYDTLFALHDATILPAPNGRFFVRAFMRLGRAMASGHNSFIIADLWSAPNTGNNVRIGEANGMLMYTVMGDGHGAQSNSTVFAPASWVCLEVLIDRARPEIDFWVNGVEVPDLHRTDFPLDNYDSVRFGFEKYAGPGLDIWYDDVAVGTERIGCN